MSQHIAVTRPSSSTAVITIDRPEKRNALDEEAWRSLGDAFIDLEAKNAVRTIVLTGTAGSFCAGDDILAFAAVRDNPQARQRYWDTIMRCYAAVSATSKPVIAAIDGPCMGGGCTLALRTDFRIGGPRALFSVPPARLGLVYPADSTALLVDAVGTTLAKYLLYTGSAIGVDRACAAGLCMPADNGDVLGTALLLADELSLGAPVSIKAAKIACDAIPLGRLASVTAEVEKLSAYADASDDYREGTAAFAEKRRPSFTGR